MLTTRDIETKEFTRTRTSGGYKAEEVDAFLDQILTDYAALLEERATLNRRIVSLNDELTDAKGEQDKWKNAILNTQKSYDEVIAAAKKKADKLVSEAQEYAKKLIETATAEANRQKELNQQIASEVETFKNNLIASYTEHIQLIRNIPTLELTAESNAEEAFEMLKAAANDSPFTDEPAAPVAEAPVDDAPTQVIPTIDDTQYTDEPATEPAPIQKRSDRYQTQRIDTSLDTEDDPFAEDEKDSYVNDKKLNGLFEDDDEEEEAPAKKGFFFGGGKKKKPAKKSFFSRDDDDDDDDDYYDEDDDE